MLVYGFLKLLSILKNKENKENVWFLVFITKKYKKKTIKFKEQRSVFKVICVSKNVFNNSFQKRDNQTVLIFKNYIKSLNILSIYTVKDSLRIRLKIL